MNAKHRSLPSALIAAGLFTATVAGQQAPLWVDQFGTDLHEYSSDLASDAVGGMFVAGSTEGNLGGASAGGRDAWLARYDSGGNRAWIVQFGSQRDDGAQALAPDGASGVFVAGYVGTELGSDAYLARYDGSGNRTWFVELKIDYSSVNALASDGTGGVFVAGNFGLARYDGNGQRLWLTQFGLVEGDIAWALTPDGAGGVLIAGETFGTLEDDHPDGGSVDALLARYDAAGSQVWITQFGSSDIDRAVGVAADGSGGAFVSGSTRGDLGGSNAGLYDAFVGHYDATGDKVWLKQFGTSGEDKGANIGVTDSGGILVAGDTEGSLGRPNAGLADVFLARFDAEGEQGSTAQFGSERHEEAWAVAMGESGDAFVAGYTTGDLGGPNAGARDAFIARFGGFCAADLDDNGALNLFDFLAFVNLFNAADPKADWNDDGAFNLFDFLGYVNSFNAGC